MYSFRCQNRINGTACGKEAWVDVSIYQFWTDAGIRYLCWECHKRWHGWPEWKIEMEKPNENKNPQV